MKKDIKDIIIRQKNANMQRHMQNYESKKNNDIEVPLSKNEREIDKSIMKKK